MGKKKSGDGNKLVVTMATTAAVFGARKLLAAGWSKATGKDAPMDPTDREISIIEALSFAAIAGIVAEVIKLLVARASAPEALPAAETAEAADAS
ncbi:MAG: DUF4235 domain-containing protein [Streptosporangiales bacterium]|jgi:hypothetical protein|nr:DUF4235 domain-containing protein [Streptosporangiales bacterium]